MVCLQPAEFLEGSCGSTAGRAHDVPSSSLQNRREWSFRTPRRGFILGERKEGGAGPRYGTTHVASPSASSFSSLPKESKWSPSSACWCGGACGATMQVSPATGEGKVAICLTRARARTHTGTVLRNPSVLCLRVRAEQKQNLKHLWGTVVRARLASQISGNVCLIWTVTSRRGRGHECFAWELSEELFRRNTIILSNSLLKPKEAWRSGFSSFNDTITNNTSIYGFFKSTQAL